MEQEKKPVKGWSASGGGKTWLAFIPSGLLLLLYPGVLIANIMAFAAEKTGDESSLVLLAVNGFLLVSTLYPVTFFVALVKYKKADSEEKKKKAVSLPYKHLALAVLFLLIWVLIGE